MRTDGIKTRITRTGKLTLAGLAVSLVCFALLITHVLTSNYDGLWYADAAYQSGAWELSLGRFLIPVIDYLRFALNVEPLQSVLTLAMLSFGSVLLWEMFCGIRKTGLPDSPGMADSGTVMNGNGMAGGVFALAFVALLCTSPAVCIFLSYRYTAPAYGFSYLTAVVAVWCLVRAEKFSGTGFSDTLSTAGKEGTPRQILRDTALAAVFLVLTLGTYQAHLGCACVAIVFYAVYLCMQRETTLQDVFRFLIRSAVASAAACVVYKVIWDITVKLANAEVPDYRGAQGLSVLGILRGLPFGVKQSYRFFFDQFFDAANRYSLLQGKPLYAGPVYTGLVGAFTGTAVFLALYCAKRQGKKGALAAVLLLALPVACGVFCLLSNETGFVSMQMTMPYMMVAPLLLAVLAHEPYPLSPVSNATTIKPDHREKSSSPDAAGNHPEKKWDRIAIALLCGLLLYGRICQTQVDQFVMYEGTNTTQRMVQDAVARAADDGLLDDADHKLMFIGVPAENTLFRKSNLFDRANGYAQFGQFWRGPYSYWRSYGGMIRRMGINREVPDLQTYVDLMEEDDVKRMPVYPEEGCMLLKDDVLIVKFANEKEAD